MPSGISNEPHRHSTPLPGYQPRWRFAIERRLFGITLKRSAVTAGDPGPTGVDGHPLTLPGCRPNTAAKDILDFIPGTENDNPDPQTEHHPHGRKEIRACFPSVKSV